MNHPKNKSKISTLVLLRHGESLWNQENRFTGWVDVDLSEKGRAEALDAGRAMKAEKLSFDMTYTSYLKRAIKTLNSALEVMDLMWLPVIKDWRLNERHYGKLQGLNKNEMAQIHGEEQVKIWRRSFDVPPPFLDANDATHPSNDPRYAHVAKDLLPSGESLKMTIERFMPMWNEQISQDLKQGKSILVVAHGNSIRAMMKTIENISDADIMEVNMPTGIPLRYQLNEDMSVLKKDFLGDQEKISSAISSVANQGKAK